VKFTLKPRDLSMVTDLGQPIVAGGAYTVTIGGGQPNTGAPTVSGTLNVNGTVDIPE
jgi:beta-glucosidase